MKTTVSVKGLSKQYQLGDQKEVAPSFREMLLSVIKSPFRNLKRLKGNSTELKTFWALKDISFDVKQGEVVGIIGRNGAGKSTLLKVLSRITTPTEGEVKYIGRMASLLEVGTGFHPELTGRENIFLNGSILGMSKKEIKKQLNDIVAFAEIDDFLDTPVKRYSSGMYVRLAFSVAAHLNPDILIVDEVLAVGDQAFQQKCLGKIKDTAESGRTVFFVSHNMTAIKSLCTRIIYLENGAIAYDGTPEDAISKYLTVDKSENATWTDDDDKHRHLKSVSLQSSTHTLKQLFQYTDDIAIQLELKAMSGYKVTSAIRVTDVFGNILFTSWDRDSLGNRMKSDNEILRCTVPQRLLKPGSYIVSAFLHILDKDGNNSTEEVNLDLEVSPEQCSIDSDRLGLLSPTLDWRVIDSDTERLSP